jgi:hypothetical protein
MGCVGSGSWREREIVAGRRSPGRTARLVIPGIRFQISDFRFKISDFRFQNCTDLECADFSKVVRGLICKSWRVKHSRFAGESY